MQNNHFISEISSEYVFASLLFCPVILQKGSWKRHGANKQYMRLMDYRLHEWELWVRRSGCDVNHGSGFKEVKMKCFSKQLSVRSIFGSVPCSCFHVFYFEVLLWFLFVSCLPSPYVFFAIGSLVQCVMFWLVVMFIVSCPHWFVLVMWPSLFVISSHVVVLFLVMYCLYLSCCQWVSSQVKSSSRFNKICSWILTMLASSGLSLQNTRTLKLFQHISLFGSGPLRNMWQTFVDCATR